MKNVKAGGKGLLKWALALAAVVAVAGLTWGLAQSVNSIPTQPSPVFRGGRATATQAFKNFFGIRPEPVQPIQYTHTLHVKVNKQECLSCHTGADKGPNARIPDITDCWGCHEFIDTTNKPELQKLADYQKRGEDIPWQRVYGWVDDSHVKFNHAPHIRAKVDCATCHGDISSMTTAKRVVDHTMGFCITCHEQRKAPNDCMTCHY